MNHQTSKKQLKLLQVFRGLAAFIVLLYHGNALFAVNLHQGFLFNIFTFGHTGVNFFFVLSGFLVFYIHQHDLGKKPKFFNFILKRFIRVYPIYWIVLLPRLLFPKTDINFLTYISSIILFPYPNPPIVNVSWTLSYEIFFYLIFSLMILSREKYIRYLIISWLFLISMYWLLRVANILSITPNNIYFQFIFSYHNLEFCFGCLSAYIVTRYRIRYGRIILIFGLFLFLLSSIFTVHTVNAMADSISASIETRTMYILSPMQKLSFIYYGIPSMLIIIGAVSLELIHEIRVPHFLIYLGDASYSVYLVHGTVINTLTNLIVRTNVQEIFESDISKLVILMISLITGCLFHSYIEKPVLTFLKNNLFVMKN